MKDAPAPPFALRDGRFPNRPVSGLMSGVTPGEPPSHAIQGTVAYRLTFPHSPLRGQRRDGSKDRTGFPFNFQAFAFQHLRGRAF